MELCESVVEALADVEMEGEPEDRDKKDSRDSNKTLSGGNKTAGNESISLNKTADGNSTVSIPIAIVADNKTAAADNKTVSAGNKTASVSVGSHAGKDDASIAEPKSDSKGELKGKGDSAGN